MDLILWKEEYDLGIPALDAQHRYVTEITNRLFENFKKDFSQEDIDGLLEKLGAAFKEHMETEEKMMADAGYEGLDEHHETHMAYAKRLQTIKTTYDRLIDPEVAASMLTFLREIWIYHITVTDRQFLPALKKFVEK